MHINQKLYILYITQLHFIYIIEIIYITEVIIYTYTYIISTQIYTCTGSGIQFQKRGPNANHCVLTCHLGDKSATLPRVIALKTQKFSFGCKCGTLMFSLLCLTVLL